MTNNERVSRWRAANRGRVRAQSAARWANDAAYREAQRLRRKQPGYRDAERQAQRDARRDRERWPSVILRDVRRRCAKEGIAFDLIPADIPVPAVCPILGVPFVFGEMGHPCSPSVDRTNPARGYVRGNVSVISRRANTMKSDCIDPEAFRRLADWLEASSLPSDTPSSSGDA